MNQYEIAKDYESGMGIKSLVVKYKSSQSSIYSILKENDVAIRPRGGVKNPLTESQINDIIMRYKSGDSLAKLESSFKVSKGRIKKILKENKVDVREYVLYRDIKENARFNYLTFKKELPLRKNKKIQWLVLCDCGNEKIVNKPDVLSGKTKSCGVCSLNKGNSRFDDREYAICRNLYSEYRKSARVRGYEFDIDFSLFKKLVLSNTCYYCGSNEKRQRKDEISNFELSYIGIDRLINSIGYTKDNVVSCCTTCNYMKKDMDVDVFLKLIDNIYKNRISK